MKFMNTVPMHQFMSIDLAETINENKHFVHFSGNKHFFGGFLYFSKLK